MMARVADPADRYLAEFESARAARRVAVPVWLAERRRSAMDRFQALGFPTTADEEWKFTSVAPIAETSFALARGGSDGRMSLDAAALASFRLTAVAGAEIVFVNGRHAPELSRVSGLPSGVRVESLASVLATDPACLEPYLASAATFDRRSFTALNTAFLADGVLISVEKGVVADAPIHALFLSRAEGRATMVHPRVLVVVGEQAQVSIIESYAGEAGAPYLTNAVSEIFVGENGVVQHYKLQRESAAGYHIGTMHAVTKRNANFSSHSMSLGGSLVRNEVVATLDGEGVECTLNGLYLGSDARLVDNHTTIDHARPHCSSREIYKGILTDHARAVFNGKIVVQPDAQKTDAKQTNKALLLSEDAQINTKPQLEIFANDVRCTHGAAVGQMDDEAIFYLRARGLSHWQARHMLIHAFAGDVVNRMPLEALRAPVEAELVRQLPEAV